MYTLSVLGCDADLEETYRRISTKKKKKNTLFDQNSQPLTLQNEKFT